MYPLTENQLQILKHGKNIGAGGKEIDALVALGLMKFEGWLLGYKQYNITTEGIKELQTRTSHV